MDTRKDVHPALKEPKKFIQLRDVSLELHREIKAMAAFNGQTIEQCVLNILENYMMDKSLASRGSLTK
jgi:hypothetical protein